MGFAEVALLPAFIAVIGIGKDMQVAFIVAGTVWLIQQRVAIARALT